MEKKDEHCQVAFLWLISIIDVLISWLFISHKYHVCCGSDIVAFLKADPSEVLRSFNLPPGRIILVEAIANVSPINNKVSQPHKYTYIYIYICVCKYSYMYMYIYIYTYGYTYIIGTHIYIYIKNILYMAHWPWLKKRYGSFRGDPCAWIGLEHLGLWSMDHL